MVATPCPVVDAHYAHRSSLLSLRTRRRTDRRSVLLLTGAINRLAKRAPGRPPSAKPRWKTRRSSRAARRAQGATAPSSKRSVKIRRLQCGALHRNRRAVTISLTARPPSGRSPRRREYRLCTVDAQALQSGQRLVRPFARTTISVIASPGMTRSSAKPSGTSATARTGWVMMLILHEKPAFCERQFHKN